MSIAETALAVTQADAEEAGRIVRRDHIRSIVAESDALMDALERCNLDGQKTTPSALRPRLVALNRSVLGEELTDLHEAVREVQAALEQLYLAQDELFDRLHPWRVTLRSAEQDEREEATGT